MSPVRSVTYVSGPDLVVHGAGDGNRTHVRSLGSSRTTIVRRPLYYTKLYSVIQPRCNRVVRQKMRVSPHSRTQELARSSAQENERQKKEPPTALSKNRRGRADAYQH